jgi:DNA-binding transcriptional regulator YhcF (GntR family)
VFAINPSDPAPIWRQIEEGVRRLIALGALHPGAPVPSMRDLARDLRVNPNTVQRAYTRLIESGVLMVRRGEGTYVAEQPSLPKKSERHEALREGATRYASTAIAVGAELDDAADELESAFERVVREHRRKA